MLSRGPVGALAVALLGVTGASLFYISRERANEHHLAARNQSLTDAVSEMRGQLASLSQTVADLSAPKPASAVPPHQVKRPARGPATAASNSGTRRRAEDARLQGMSAQLAEQQKQLAGTREELDKTKEELSDRLSSTRDELSTSIAKNHDELVALQKRGERSYYEFKLDKSKRFDRVGPVRLAVRKVDVKHKNFNVALMVDDNQLQKKNVNLYEPVWVSVDGGDLELVVNQIRKDHIEGYLSEPKFRKSESRPTLQDSGTEP